MKFRQLIIFLLISSPMFLGKIPDELMEIEEENLNLQKFFIGFDEIYRSKAKLRFEDFKDFFIVLNKKEIKEKLATVLKEYLTSNLNMKDIKINTENMISNIKDIIKINLKKKSFVWLRPHSHFIFMSHSEIEKVVLNVIPQSQLSKVDKRISYEKENIAKKIECEAKEKKYSEKEKEEKLNEKTSEIDELYKRVKLPSRSFLEISSKRKITKIRKMKMKAKPLLNTITGVNPINDRVTDQGKCGACWAYSHSTLLTYKFNKLALQNNTAQMNTIFSPQFLFDCFHSDSVELLDIYPLYFWINGCKGSRSNSDDTKGVIKLMNMGVNFPNINFSPFLNASPSEDYPTPWKENDGYGRYSRKRCEARLESTHLYPPSFPLNNGRRWESMLLTTRLFPNRNIFYNNLRDYGPAVVSIGLDTQNGVSTLVFYEGGAITNEFCKTNIIGINVPNHSAVITGYIPNQPIGPNSHNLNIPTMEVWVVKNSWGPAKNLLFSAEGDGNTCYIMEDAITYINVDIPTENVGRGCCGIF